MSEEDSVLGLLMQQFEAEKTELAKAVLEGAAHDYAQYKELCGRMYGLQIAQRFVLEMENRLRKQLE